MTEYSSLLVHCFGRFGKRPRKPGFVFDFAASPRVPADPSRKPCGLPSKPAGSRDARDLSSSLPNPKSQPFSRSFKSTLPTSLTHIILWTRGCSPWGPDAVMGTIGDGTFVVVLLNRKKKELLPDAFFRAPDESFFFFSFVRSVCCFWASFNFHASIEPVQTFHETRNALPTFPSLISNQAEVNVYVQFFARQN